MRGARRRRRDASEERDGSSQVAVFMHDSHKRDNIMRFLMRALCVVARAETFPSQSVEKDLTVLFP